MVTMRLLIGLLLALLTLCPVSGAIHVFWPTAPTWAVIPIYLVLLVISVFPLIGITVGLGLVGIGIYGLATGVAAFDSAMALGGIIYPFLAPLVVAMMLPEPSRPDRPAPGGPSDG